MGRADEEMKCIRMRTLMKQGAYEEALDVAESIDLDRVKSIVDLKWIASIYEKMGEYRKAKDILLKSYDKKPTKMTIYRLAYLSVKTEEFEDAENFYEEFSNMAPNSPDRYILRYGIDRAKNVDYVLRIATLQKLKQIEYTEEWGYELAKIYHKAGLHEECIRECKDLIVWFGSGVIVDKAKLLCKYHEEGKAALDAYGVLDQDLTEEELMQNREQFVQDTQDLSEVTKEAELHQMIDLDMEKTMNLQQVLQGNGEEFDLLRQEIHRSWGGTLEQYKANMPEQEPVMEPILQEPMGKADTEAMLAASVAEMMDQQAQQEHFDAQYGWEQQMVQPEGPETYGQMQEILPEQYEATGQPQDDAFYETYEETPVQETEYGMYGEEPGAYEEYESYETEDGLEGETVEEAGEPEAYEEYEGYEVETDLEEETVEETGEPEAYEEYESCEMETDLEGELAGEIEETAAEEKLYEEQKPESETEPESEEEPDEVEETAEEEELYEEQKPETETEPESQSESEEDLYEVEETVAEEEPEEEAETETALESEPESEEEIADETGVTALEEKTEEELEVAAASGNESESQTATDEEVESQIFENDPKEKAKVEDKPRKDSRSEEQEEPEKEDVNKEVKILTRLIRKFTKGKKKTEQPKKQSSGRIPLETERIDSSDQESVEQLLKKEEQKRKSIAEETSEQPILENIEEELSEQSVQESIEEELPEQSVQESTEEELTEQAKQEDTEEEQSEQFMQEGTVEEQPEQAKPENTVEEIPETELPVEETVAETQTDSNLEGDFAEEETAETQLLEEMWEKESEDDLDVEEEPEPLSFMEQYGETLQEYFARYQSDTRLYQSVFESMEQAMCGTRPMNFLVTCKNKERAAEFSRTLARALKALGLSEKQQVARITAEKLNRMHLEQKYDQLKGGVLLVEEAKKMTDDTAQSIMNLINEMDGQIIVILTDARPYMMDLFERYRMMKAYFPFDLSMR